MSSNQPAGRVFVTHENPALNYLPAEEFGELVFLTKDELSPVKGSIRNGSLIDEIRHKLQSFEPNLDYICLSGSPAGRRL